MFHMKLFENGLPYRRAPVVLASVISRNELEFSERRAERFHLYRLFEFRDTPRMFALQGNMRSRLKLNPVNFLARVG